jgi:LuxR family transcriptional regulator, maltose regulon positive regulatory protein
VRPIPVLRARVLAAQDRVAEAWAWAREQGLSATDELSHLREFEHITPGPGAAGPVRAQDSAGSVDDATGLLARLLQAAEAGERTGSALEILVLQALTGQARGVFAGEGPPMASLLRRVAKQRPAWDYVRRLLHACTGAGGTAAVGPDHTRQTAPGRAPERA